jgi:hypothetical protein
MTRKPRRPNKFDGKLAKKIVATEQGEIDGERDKKMELLFKHYQIPRGNPNSWNLLALALAIDFVPGMKRGTPPVPRDGRPKTWKAGRGELLIAAVEAIMREKQVPETFAYHMVAQDEKWKDVSAKSIRNRYNEAKKRRDARLEQNRASTIGFIRLMGDLPDRPIATRIEQARASERPDSDLDFFLKKLAELSSR